MKHFRVKINNEILIRYVPEKDKCFKYKLLNAKMIHSITGKGLPLYLRNESEYEQYEEVDIKGE